MLSRCGLAVHTVAELVREPRRQASRPRCIPGRCTFWFCCAPRRHIGIERTAFAALGLAAFCEERLHFVGHQEFGLGRPTHVGFCERDLNVAERVAVGLARAFDGLAAEADHRAHDDHRGAVGFSLAAFKSRANASGVAAVNAVDYVPAVGLVSHLYVFGKGDVGLAVDGDLVVVVHEDEVADAKVPGQRTRFARYAFHQVAVAHHAVNHVAAGSAFVVATGRAELGCGHATRERHADCVRYALPERTRRDFNAWGFAVFRMPRCLRTELSEVDDVFVRNVVTPQVE